MVAAETLELIAREDDRLLADLVSLILRRRAGGFRPVLLVSVDDERRVISDINIARDEAEDLIAFLHDDGLADVGDSERELN